MSRRPAPSPAATRPASALDEVARLEAAAEQRQRADEDARERVARANREAGAALAAARALGQEEAASRRAGLLATADRDVERILEKGRGTAASVRHDFERRLPDLLAEALQLILPATAGRSATTTPPEGR
jgi:hypothetical protein